MIKEDNITNKTAVQEGGLLLEVSEKNAAFSGSDFFSLIIHSG